MKLKLNNKKGKNIIFLIVYSTILASVVYFGTTFKLYRRNLTNDLENIYFAYYIDGVITNEMPRQNQGYTLDTDKSNCNNGVIPAWDNASWQFTGNFQKYNNSTNTRTKCTLYFNKTAKNISTVLGNIEVNSYTPDFTKSACDDSSCESHEKGIFETTDYDGNPTYYYRGSVENNYVKFAGFYWRIIRINSNGSLRVIYDGTSAHDNGESSEDRQYGTVQFNQTWTNNMYLGYMYKSGEAHGTENSSIIKSTADKFYTDKLKNYTSKLDNTVGYCGDRSPLNLISGVGTENVITYNKGYLRVIQNEPTLTCEDENDYYTLKTASTGNKSLDYLIGLITVDEVILAGHTGGIFDGTYNNFKPNKKSYLTTNNNFFTMTPAGGYIPFGNTGWHADMFYISAGGYIDDTNASSTLGFRPVINISSSVSVTGAGTKTNPYQIN